MGLGSSSVPSTAHVAERTLKIAQVFSFLFLQALELLPWFLTSSDSFTLGADIGLIHSPFCIVMLISFSFPPAVDPQRSYSSLCGCWKSILFCTADRQISCFIVSLEPFLSQGETKACNIITT